MYGFTTTPTGATFDPALAKTIAALKAEGFGVLSDIDVQHAMKEKLGVDMPPTASLAPATHRWRTKPCRRCPTSACCCRAT